MFERHRLPAAMQTSHVERVEHATRHWLKALTAAFVILAGSLPGRPACAAWVQDKFIIGADLVTLPWGFDDTSHVNRSLDLLRDCNVNTLFRIDCQNGGQTLPAISTVFGQNILLAASTRGIRIGSFPEGSSSTPGWSNNLGYYLGAQPGSACDEVPVFDGAVRDGAVSYRAANPNGCIYSWGRPESRVNAWRSDSLFDVAVNQYYVTNAYPVWTYWQTYPGCSPLGSEGVDPANPIPFWTFGYVDGSAYHHPNPTEASLRAMALVPISFGAKGMVWSQFSSANDLSCAVPNPQNQCSDLPGALRFGHIATQHYPRIAKINAYLRDVLGPVVMKSERVCTLHRSCGQLNYNLCMPCDENAAGYPKYLPASDKPLFKQTGDISSEDFLVTVFRPQVSANDPAGTYYLLVYNLSLTGSASGTLKLRSTTTHHEVGAAESIADYSGDVAFAPVPSVDSTEGADKVTTITVSLDAAAGRVYKVVPSTVPSDLARLTQYPQGSGWTVGQPIVVSWTGMSSGAVVSMRIVEATPANSLGMLVELGHAAAGESTLTTVLPNVRAAQARIEVTGLSRTGVSVTLRQRSSFTVTADLPTPPVMALADATGGSALTALAASSTGAARLLLTEGSTAQPYLYDMAPGAGTRIPSPGFAGQTAPYGMQPAMAMDGEGNEHIVFSTLYNPALNGPDGQQALRYIHKVSGNWVASAEDIDVVGGFEGDAALALGSDGTPFVAYNSGLAGGYSLKTRWFNAALPGWEEMAESAPGWHPRDIRMKVASDWTTWLTVIREQTISGAKRSRLCVGWPGYENMFSQLDVSGADMILGSDELPIVVMVRQSPDSGNSRLCVRRVTFDMNWSTYGWSAEEVIEDSPSALSSPCIAAEGTGLRVGFLCNGLVREAVYNGSSWQVSDVQSPGYGTEQLRLVVGESGRWYSYWDKPAQLVRRIRLVSNTGSGDGGGGEGECCTGEMLPAITLESANPTLSNGALHFAMQLPRAATVGMRLYDIAGRAASTRPDQHMAPGQHRLEWAPGGLRAGVYFLRVSVDGRESMKRRLVFIR